VDQIKQMMDQLSELDNDQVTDLQNQIIKEFEAVLKVGNLIVIEFR